MAHDMDARVTEQAKRCGLKKVILSELQVSVQNAFNWFLDEAPRTGSAQDIAKIILWLYNCGAHPNAWAFNTCDHERAQQVIEIIEYFLMINQEPHHCFLDGRELVDRIIEQYGRNEQWVAQRWRLVVRMFGLPIVVGKRTTAVLTSQQSDLKKIS